MKSHFILSIFHTQEHQEFRRVGREELVAVLGMPRLSQKLGKLVELSKPHAVYSTDGVDWTVHAWDEESWNNLETHLRSAKKLSKTDLTPPGQPIGFAWIVDPTEALPPYDILVGKARANRRK